MNHFSRTATFVIASFMFAPSAPAADPPTLASPADSAAIARFVQQEVQRQLPAAVQAEVKRQVDALIAQAQKERRPTDAMATLQTLRAQLELYKIQHGDAFPTMKNLADWKALIKPTDATGGTEGYTAYGPYIRGKPVNPYTRSSTIVVARTASAQDGWTWDTKEGILRIVIPEGERQAIDFLGDNADVVKGSPEPVTPQQSAALARVNSAESTLMTMRSQLELYKIQHADKPPTWKQMAGWSALTHSTDINGNPGKALGPYIQSAPANPFNGKSALAPAGAATPDSGWTYNETDGKFRIVATPEQARTLAQSLTADDLEIPN